MDAEYYYGYLRDFLDEQDDPRKDDEEFIRDRAEYAASVFEAETKAGTYSPNEVATKVLMEGLCHEQEEEITEEGVRAKDLMVGDWVYNSNKEKCKVHGISEIFDSNITLDNYDKEDDGCFEMELEVSPIPLTSEILEANGIRRKWGANHWSDEDHILDFFFWKENRIELHIGRKDDCQSYVLKLDVKYVHQVQHAMTLCGVRKVIRL